MDIWGKKAIVFGGTSGIGLATTVMLAEAGATVTAISRNATTSGPYPAGVTLQNCDVRDAAAIDAVLRDCAPDILISAATGGERARGPFLEMDMDAFKGSFDKLWGYANVVRFGAEHLRDGGSITLVSGSPARNPKLGQIALSAVGGAVEAFARAAARELAPRIRVNVVSPGIIDTPLMPFEGNARKSVIEQMTRNNLIARAGTAEEVARAILFVVENDFVTGTTVDVDGGVLLS